MGFVEFFNTILTDPLFNVLVWLYNVIPGNDLGVAIIVLTILIKAALFPLSAQSIKAQKSLQELQPKIEELKKKYKDDREAQAREMMALYKAEKVNPLSSCLPLLIQLPFLIAVFHVFSRGFDAENLNALYPFVMNPGMLNPIGFGFLDLAVPNIILAFITGAAQFWQARMLTHTRQPKVEGSKDENMMASVNKQMMYIMPVITVVISMSLPAGLVLYWLITTVLTALQQILVFKKMNPQDQSVVNADTHENVK